MNSSFIWMGLSLALVGAAGYGLYTAQARRAASLRQLAQLEARLATGNEQIT